MSAELNASRRDATLILTLSNPGRRNALHPDMYAAAIETLTTAERDDSLRAVVLSGADRDFCAGSDTRAFHETGDHALPGERRAAELLQDWLEAIRACPKPVIAAVEGTAAGPGFALALACDFIVAGESARFSAKPAEPAPPSTLPLPGSPGTGLPHVLARLVPRQLAGELLLFNRPVSSARLHELGIVNHVARDGEALTAALDLADECAGLAPEAVERLKTWLHDAGSTTQAAA